MTVTPSNPAGLPVPDLYHQVAVATGQRMVFVAGQVSVDADGAKVGIGDLAAQVEQTLVNVDTAVRAQGGTFDDIAKYTVYVTEWTLDKMPEFADGVSRAAERIGAVPVAPASLIGVSVLFDPDFEVEIEAIAVLD